MTRYFLVTILVECLLLYTMYKSRNSPATPLNRLFTCFFSVIGLLLILINLGLQIPGLYFHRNMSGLTGSLVFFGLLFIHQSNQETRVLKNTPLTIVTMLIIILFFISFTLDISDVAKSVSSFV